MIEDNNILKKFTKDFCQIVQKYTKYVIVSGLVCIATGRVRGTEDIDIIIEKMNFENYKKLHEELLEKFEILSPGDLEVKEIYKEYLCENIPIRFVFPNEIFPNMEFKFAKNLIDIEALKTRQKIKNSFLSNIYFSNIELQIAFKEKYLKSQKDIEDALHLREMFIELIDKNKIKKYEKMIKEVL
jgi:hypothetical protein